MMSTFRIALGFVVVTVPWWMVSWMMQVSWGPDTVERTVFFAGVPTLLLISGFGLALIVKAAKEL